jgi:hypothetical protein
MGMVSTKAKWGLVGLAITTALPAQAQSVSSHAASVQKDSEPDDIVVTGYRLRLDRDSRVRPPAMLSTAQNRQKYEMSERLAKCAARSRLSSIARLRAVVDGSFNSAAHAFAQDRLKRTYITCSEGTSLLSFTQPPQSELQQIAADSGDFSGSPGIIDNAPLGHSIYDRGAFTIQALKMFAGDLTLTRKDTEDRAVQARFDAREIPRNRFRLPSDYRYFATAVCMVRFEPALAVRLALSDGPAQAGDLQDALIDRTRLCVGGAKRVRIDPSQFRLYIADAVYRWAVAAKGVDSLIPAG